MAALLVIAGTATWFLAGSLRDRGAADVPGTKPGAAGPQVADPGSGGGKSLESGSEDEVDASAEERLPVEVALRRVVIRLVDEHGEPSSGEVVWRQSFGRPPFFARAEFASARAEAGAATCAVPRSGAEIEVDPEAWVSLTARSGPGVERRTLAPGPGPDRVELAVSPGSRILDVVVLDTDLRTVVQDGAIRLVGPAGQDEPGSVPIDAVDGVTRIDLGSRVHLTLLAPGAEESDGPPHAVRVPLPVATSRVAACRGRRAR